MNVDFRVASMIPAHPKIKKLKRLLGFEGCWGYICLLAWVSTSRTDGQLTGLSPEDLEIAIDWAGEPGAFVSGCREVGLIDGELDSLEIHDWADHNPWVVGAKSRSDIARWKAIKRHHGRQEADRLVPSVIDGKIVSNATQEMQNDAVCNAHSMPSAMQVGTHSIAPSPSPSPFPSPFPSPKENAKKPGKHPRAESYLLDEWIASLDGEEAIVANDPIFDYANKAGIPDEFMEICWHRFCEQMRAEQRKKKDWRAHFRNAVRGNWFKLWWFDQANNRFQLTTAGEQARLAS